MALIRHVLPVFSADCDYPAEFTRHAKQAINITKGTLMGSGSVTVGTRFKSTE